ncbi:hypothetical protein HOV12_gp25 [Streptomyces phage Lilbooboo]|uniref:Uncharacterized protein n=1 Tax=Streptomyces phage Lilbooboo TaxID=2510571 RepID=A0A411B2Z4_9CAUD|nr:hypothetical protein HOV12_gp25 [Streptomyces phage Lilbooboo]QAX94725.1 hypothetical protein SEA_LILBOOBOO_25 [Streptomyces phage Lilbooboo]
MKITGTDVLTFLAAVAVGFVLGVAGLSFAAFLVMILVGMWHGFNDAIPALGFVDCVYGVGLTLLLAGIVRTTQKN